MAKTIELQAEARKVTGRKVKTLRSKGVTPANIYGKDVKSTSIQVKVKEFREVFKKAGETGIIEITIGKDKRPVLVHNVQVHPVTGDIIHIDFHQVNLKEKVSAQIPVEIIGESPAEKSGIGTVVLLMQELEVEALPTDFPDKFEVDATKLENVDQTVKVADLKYDKAKVEVKADPETIIVKVEPPQKEEVIVAPVAAEVPAEGEAAPVVEGEAAKPAEGEKPAEEKKEEVKK